MNVCMDTPQDVLPTILSENRTKNTCVFLGRFGMSGHGVTPLPNTAHLLNTWTTVFLVLRTGLRIGLVELFSNFYRPYPCSLMCFSPAFNFSDSLICKCVTCLVPLPKRKLECLVDHSLKKTLLKY